jgi:predicted RNase H-like nuclease (RuvC/YqgF family)
MSVEQQQPDTVQGFPAELKAVESSLKALWERARRTSEVIHGLREEKRELQAKVEQMENEMRRLQQDMAKKEQTLRTVGATGDEASLKKAFIIGNGERDALAARIKLLLAKLEAYL